MGQVGSWIAGTSAVLRVVGEIEDGAADGATVGEFDGTTEGPDDGAIVGADDGAVVGFNDWVTTVTGVYWQPHWQRLPQFTSFHFWARVAPSLAVQIIAQSSLLPELFGSLPASYQLVYPEEHPVTQP